MRISFIGGGVMGEAMLSGLLKKGVAEPGDIIVSDIDRQRLEDLEERHHIRGTSDNRDAVKGSDIVVLSIKPQSLSSVMAELKGGFGEKQLVLSIVAGVGTGTIRQGLGHSSVVRVMPNIPIQIGEGISIWTATEAVSGEQREKARVILAALGRELYIPDERYIDMATAVSGSGPAYILLVIESLIDAAVHIGLPRELAKELVLQTVIGSARLAQESDRHPAELRNMATSPGGTTAEGLLQLDEGGLRAILAQAVIAAYEKARALAQGE